MAACNFKYSIAKGWRVVATVALEESETVLNLPVVDPYTDIVLSACCTADQEPNVQVSDHGHTLVAIKCIAKGDELVTHCGLPQAGLLSAGLVRLIASSTLARAMHMDMFASDDEKMGASKRQRAEAKSKVAQHPDNMQQDPQSIGGFMCGPPPPCPTPSRTRKRLPNSTTDLSITNDTSYMNNNGSNLDNKNNTCSSKKMSSTNNNRSNNGADSNGTPKHKPAHASRVKPGCQSRPQTNQSCPQQQQESHTTPNTQPPPQSPSTQSQPLLPPPLLPHPWLHLAQNVYIGAAVHVRAEMMGAESDEDLEGKGRGRRFSKVAHKNPSKRAGKQALEGRGTWKPFLCHCNPEHGRVCSDEHGCFNRAQHVECTPGECSAGELCQNQRIQKQQSPYLMLRHVGEEKGWGVLAGEPVPAGAFIVQYTGEVVTKEAADARLQQYEALHIPHYYLMTLSNELVLDATRAGSMARFVNHSSLPNCKTEKWLVGGREVVIIAAKRDIVLGEELCYDYNCANGCTWFSCC